jgi:hypothetical protein
MGDAMVAGALQSMDGFTTAASVITRWASVYAADKAALHKLPVDAGQERRAYKSGRIAPEHVPAGQS